MVNKSQNRPADSGASKLAAAEYVPVEALRPWVKNPRRNDPAVAAVTDSIKRFGFGAPILARRENGEVIAGHTRLKAAVRLGLKEVPVRYLDLDEREAHALALADNKVGELAEWDDEMLANVLREMAEDGASLDGLGFDDAELKRLLATADHPDDDDSEEPLPLPEPDKAQSVAGEVYQLGPHRLVCGDSRDAEVWAKLLLDGERLRMGWTDPPYGVAYVGKTKDALTIENDALSAEQLAQLLRDSLGMAVAQCTQGAAWYVAAPAGPLHNTFGAVLIELDVWKRSLVWVKDVFVLGRG
jgi:ParB-like chromosome segregation protein Spo0J